jgi:hypothetical protein
MKLKPYRARDRRCYDGAPCSDLQRELDRTRELENRMKQLDRTASCTYFPIEGKYMVFTNSNYLENPGLKGPPVELTGNFHVDKQEALIEAIQALST